MNSTFIKPMVTDVETPKQQNDYSIGAYKQDGEIFVYVDSLDPTKLSVYGVKQAAYDYRTSIGMAYSGIGQVGTPFILTPDDPPTMIKQANEKKSKPVWRQLFKLTPML